MLLFVMIVMVMFGKIEYLFFDVDCVWFVEKLVVVEVLMVFIFVEYVLVLVKVIFVEMVMGVLEDVI